MITPMQEEAYTLPPVSVFFTMEHLYRITTQTRSHKPYGNLSIEPVAFIK